MTMHSFLSNLYLFAQVIFKVGIYCGFGPGILIACVLSRGRTYRVLTYWNGLYDQFVGRCTQLTKYRVEILVLDAGPPPRVSDKCPFPECIREEHGAGEHEFPRIRIGALISVVVKYSTFEEAEFSGRAVSHSENRASEVPATSPPRNERRYA